MVRGTEFQCFRRHWTFGNTSTTTQQFRIQKGQFVNPRILEHKALPVIIGQPNAGKTTLLQALNKYHSTLVSMGDMCRAEKKKNTEIWQQAEAHMRKTSSTLWPTEAIVRMLDQNLNGEPEGMIFEGMLRAPEQGPVVWEIAHRYGCNRVKLFVVETTDAECIRRAAARKRDDDEEIERRLADFHRDTLQAISDLIRSRPLDVDKVTFDSTEMFANAERYARTIADIMGFKLKA